MIHSVLSYVITTHAYTRSMTARKHEFTDTIDWDRYWQDRSEDASEEYTASVSGGHYERVARFFDQVGIPDDAAFVGCGPSSLSVKIATKFPDMHVVGCDAAWSVIKENRDEYAGLSNLTFEQAILPTFDIDQEFDFVFCYATLHYVREIERAIENLYAHVRSDGHFVFNYPNRAYQDDHQGAEGQLRERLQLPINGENLLSQERIADILDADVRDFWEFVDTDGPFVRPANPCVIVDR